MFSSVMPNQNLPKPQLPGNVPGSAPIGAATQPVATPGQAVAATSPPTPPGATPLPAAPPAATPPPSQPPQAPKLQPLAQRQAQVVPGGLSQENPGGTPPGVKVVSLQEKVEQSKAAAAQSELTSKSKDLTPPGARQEPTLPGGRTTPPTPSLPGQVTSTPGQLRTAPVTAVPPQTAQPTPSIPGQKRPEAASGQPTIAAAPPSAPQGPTSSAAPASGIAENGKAANGSEAKKGFKLPKVLLFALIGVVVLLLALVGIRALTGNNQQQPSSGSSSGGPTQAVSSVTLTYWGLWEDSRLLADIIAEYENNNPGVKIDYRKQSHVDYRERLQQAIQSGTGPDIFRYHATWVPMLGSDLAALPTTVMTVSEYQSTFYPVALTQLQYNGQLVGIPLMYEGLALLYNKEMLETANLPVPSTWSELRDAAKKLTVPADINERSGGNITQAGLAIGNAGNVDNFSDILALLILQNGGDPAKPDTQYVRDALTFYTNFVKVDRVWSDRLANSTVAFAKGDVAMILVPSWRIHDVKNLNPALDFGVAPVPQLDSSEPVTWATYWVEGVSNKSKNKEAAWKFLKHMSSPEILKRFYASASDIRSFGEIYPRQDMAAELEGDQLVGAYVLDAPQAKGWYMASFTHDNGLNDQVIKYYEDAVNAMLSGQSADKALAPVVSGMNDILSRYRLQ